MFALWPLFLAFAFFGAFLSALVSGTHVVVSLILFIVSAAAVIALWSRGTRRVCSYFIGARGEERVAAALGALPEGWHVFHDFPSGTRMADHVVVGPAGIFAIETKNWRGRVEISGGTVSVDGEVPSRNPLHQARTEAVAVGKAFGDSGWNGQVRAVLCFAGNPFTGGEANVAGVDIVNIADLAGWMAALPHVLDGTGVDRLVHIACTCNT